MIPNEIKSQVGTIFHYLPCTLIDIRASLFAKSSFENILKEFYHPAIQGCRQVDDSYKFLNRVAEGTYGVVFRAEDKKSGEICALKRLKMEKEREGFPITSLREIVTLLKGKEIHILN